MITDISDHFPIFTVFPFTVKTHSSNPNCFRKMSADNLRRFKTDLQSSDWSAVYDASNPNLSFKNFMNNFNHLYDKNIPLVRTKNFNRKSQPKSPWITTALLKSINHKNRLYQKYLRSPSDSNRQKHIHYRNLLTTVLRSAKQNYYTQQFDKEKNNIKLCVNY